MSKFLRNFELDRFDENDPVEKMKKRGTNLNPKKRNNKTNKPKREKVEP
jgi:hypothetical protein